jgi:hypothetical protein
MKIQSQYREEKAARRAQASALPAPEAARACAMAPFCHTPWNHPSPQKLLQGRGLYEGFQ